MYISVIPTVYDCTINVWKIIDAVHNSRMNKRCRPVWLEMDRKVCPTATTSPYFATSSA